MSRKQIKYYEEIDSPFYRLRSQKRLAELLWISKRRMRSLARDESLYCDFQQLKASGGSRTISAPCDELKKVQKRIASLLSRIKPPDYLYAPVSGRSYVENALAHVGSDCIRLLDIENYFPNCKGNKVIWFFEKRLQCSVDVAAIIKGLVTKNGSLPQGSPCSPILAFFCYIDMWEEIDDIVKNENCKLSVYIDDITISGSSVPERMIWQVKRVIHKHGHRYNRMKERSKIRKPTEITGVIVSRNGLSAPNRQHKARYDLNRSLLRANGSDEEVDKLKAQLHGRESQMRQIASKNLKNRNEKDYLR